MATASPRRKRGHDRGTGHDESDAEDADAWEYENGAGSSSSFQRAGSLPDVRLDATIKLFVTHTEPHYSLPWQMRRQTSSTSTGFVIEGKRILTNAHCVDNFAVVKVKKRASSTKYVAEVIAIGRECDLALLTVADPEFWQHITPIKLAQRLPTLQDEVTVVGFPVGGDNLAITQGVVSRIDMQEYVHGCCELLAVQIDAAINPGNSGGPAFGGEDHECVGIAFQSLKDGQTENIGYIIPTEVADHFLTDVKQGHYKGFVELGLELQRCENPTLRVHAGLKPKQSGLLVKMVHPTSGAAESDVRRGDVVTHIDNVPLANDGTVPFRAGGGRIAFSYLLSQRYVGESSTMKILRGGNALPPKKVPLRVHSLLVPESSEHRKTGVRCPDLRLPSYLIIGGVVFTPLCEPYLRSEYGDDFDQKAPIKLLDRWQYGIKESADAQVVVLSQVREWEREHASSHSLTHPHHLSTLTPSLCLFLSRAGARAPFERRLRAPHQPHRPPRQRLSAHLLKTARRAFGPSFTRHVPSDLRARAARRACRVGRDQREGGDGRALAPASDTVRSVCGSEGRRGELGGGGRELEGEGEARALVGRMDTVWAGFIR